MSISDNKNNSIRELSLDDLENVTGGVGSFSDLKLRIFGDGPLDKKTKGTTPDPINPADGRANKPIIMKS